MKSGMLAAETALDALVAGRQDAETMAAYDRRFLLLGRGRAEERAELPPGFDHGLWMGMVDARLLTGGLGFGERPRWKPGPARMGTPRGDRRHSGVARTREALRQHAHVHQAERRVSLRDEVRRISRAISWSRTPPSA
jgi:hypothetical protein